MYNVVLKSFRETLAAGEYRAIRFYSRMLTILSNSNLADIGIGIGEMQPVPLKAGLQYELPQGESFDKLLIYNQEAVPTTVEFVLSVGEVRDNRMSVAGQIDVTDADLLAQIQGDTSAEGYGCVTVGVAAVQVVAQNADRKGIDIQSDPDNVDYIYLGYDNTVTTAKWFAKLSPGQAFSRDNIRSAIYAISGTAGQNVGYGEV
jgi:hypothetical protein